MSNTVPCRICGEKTGYLHRKMCDTCQDLKRLIDADPQSAAKLLRERLQPAPEPGMLEHARIYLGLKPSEIQGSFQATHYLDCQKRFGHEAWSAAIKEVQREG